MKATELRIGNWVKNKHRTEPYQVWPQFFAQCFFTDKHPYDLTKELSFVEPIPLTEEWLVKLGFFKSPISYEIDISVFPQLEYKTLGVDIHKGIFIRQGDIEESRILDDVVSVWNIDVQGPIHVHQLQNLYFALTGEELTPKD